MGFEDDEFDDLEDEDFSELQVEFFVDKTRTEDAADYFASELQWEFPSIELERYEANEWRVGWTIQIPAQFDQPVRKVEELARSLRERLWWDKSILVPFTIEQMQ